MKAAALSIIGILFICLSAYSQENGSSTLDSLQGNWYLKENRNEEIRIMHDTLLYVSANNIVDAGILYVNNTFLDSSDINGKSHNGDEVNGKFLAIQSGVFRYYEIKSISATELILFKNEETLTYIKE